MPAPRPVILAVDDDPPVLSAVERDLRARYARAFRIAAAGSGPEALDALRQFTLRGTPIALLVADQRMPGMTGVEFLAAAREFAPNARRVLLTAYADTEAAIRAINDIRLDHYLMKPWDPPEERLYPVLDDLLDEWQATFQPPFEGVQVVGTAWLPRLHEIKDYLGRNLIPFRTLDTATDSEARRLAQAAGWTEDDASAGQLPLVVFPDGGHLFSPTNLQIAERLGLRTRAEAPFYDLIIVGGGPAGLAAAVYGASEGLGTLLVEREAPGGQAGTTSRIENYLGFPAGLAGADLTRRAVAQARRLGAEILTPQEATAVRLADPYRTVELADGSMLNCRALLIATGVQYRTLDAPGVAAFTGAGVYYGAAITEAAFYRGQDVVVLGGGNSAGQAAVYLSGFARSVTLVVRAADLGHGMSKYLVDQIAAIPSITVRLRSGVTAVRGTTSPETVEIVGGEATPPVSVPAAALFIFIGASPRTDWLGDLVQRDEGGFILTGPALSPDGGRPRGWHLPRDPFLLESSMPGIFAAGDVRHASVKRIASSVGEGAMAVQFIHQYLAGA